MPLGGQGGSMKAHRPHNDLEHVRRELADRAEDLFLYLYGKPVKRTRNELRWGHKESLALYFRGRNGPRFHSYEADQGGDMLAFIEWSQGVDFTGALEWARDFLGHTADDDRPRSTRHKPPPRKQSVVDYDAELADKARRVADLAAALK